MNVGSHMQLSPRRPDFASLFKANVRSFPKSNHVVFIPKLNQNNFDLVRLDKTAEARHKASVPDEPGRERVVHEKHQIQTKQGPIHPFTVILWCLHWLLTYYFTCSLFVLGML